jgi:hypothetical protein
MINQIIIYTRPWEVKFHVALGQALNKQYPKAHLKFVTFFYDTHQYLVKNKLDSMLFTEKLKKIQQLKDISHIDKELNQCGLNLNMLAAMERFLPKERKAANEFIVKHTMILDELITENTLSISSMFDHFIYVLAGMLANIRNGYHFAFLTADLPPNRVIALKTPWETWNYNYPAEYAKMLLADSVSKMEIPAEKRIAYMKKTKNIPFYRRSLKTIKEYIKSQSEYNRGNYFYSNHLPNVGLRNSLTIHLRKLKNYYSNFDILTLDELKTNNNQFIYCPLHMEPEATIFMYSPWLRDQIELCRLISQDLPIGVYLLVKENPKMINVRSSSFYKKLKELHNVILVSPEIESKVLIDKSIGVISLAGNASFEATILGKHSMCFAKPPFADIVEYSNFAEKFKLNDLHKIILNWLNKSDYSMDFSKWHTWVNGTFEGNLLPQKSLKTNKNEIIVTEETLSNCVQYIKSAIQTKI